MPVPVARVCRGGVLHRNQPAYGVGVGCPYPPARGPPHPGLEGDGKKPREVAS